MNPHRCDLSYLSLHTLKKLRLPCMNFEIFDLVAIILDPLEGSKPLSCLHFANYLVGTFVRGALLEGRTVCYWNLLKMVALRLACSLAEHSFVVVSKPVAGLQPIEVFASVEQPLFLCFSPAINYLWPSPWELLFHYLYLKEISRMCPFVLSWISQVLILTLSVIKKATHS